MNLYLHKLKKNWVPLALAVLVVVFAWGVRACGEAKYKRDIKELDEDISVLKKKNVKLEDEAVEYIKGAEADQREVERLKVEIVESKLRIEDLEREEIEIERVVMELPPSRLVENLQKALKCEEILLNEDGILFSVECARQGLLKLEKFSLVEKKYDEAIFALSKSEKALQFSERRSWKLYGALWKLGGVVLNLRVITKKQDIKFTKSERQRKKGWLRGLGTGLAIGAGITVTFVLIIPAIKAIF